MYQGASQRISDRRLITPLLSAGSSSGNHPQHLDQQNVGMKDVYRVISNEQMSNNLRLTGSTNGNRLPQRHQPNVVTQKVAEGALSMDYEINGTLPDKIPDHSTVTNNPRLSLETQI